ncbi:hypothetical protein ES332_D06G003500v1 [Gossypium tomentosum]|uniref:Uncharacterized protein n=1 Tax=Gossypium tomentosum TaxID=34277 RepID=A0A5D2KD39_GOSTO|nr:hypothetical protein ES332_D06G003500v1 [Gossypium tomentosum]
MISFGLFLCINYIQAVFIRGSSCYEETTTHASL